MNLLSYFLHFSCEFYKSCIEYLHAVTLRSCDFRQHRHRGNRIAPTDITTFLSALLTFHFIVAVLQFGPSLQTELPNRSIIAKFYIRLKVLQNLALYVKPRLFIYIYIYIYIYRRLRDNEKQGRRREAEEFYNIFSHIYSTRKKRSISRLRVDRLVLVVHVTSFAVGATDFKCSMEVFRFSIRSLGERSVVIKSEGHPLFLIDFTWFSHVEAK